MGFQYRRYFRVNLTPAQFAGMVDGLNNLILTDEGQQWWLGIHHIKQPFAVYHPQHAHAPAVIRYPGDGQIDAGKRDPRHGWIDVIERADGGSDMVITYNFAHPDPVLRLLLWEKLLGWLEGQGGKVWEDKLVSDNDNTAQEETQNEVAEPFTGSRAAAVTEPANDEMGTPAEVGTSPQDKTTRAVGKTKQERMAYRRQRVFDGRTRTPRMTIEDLAEKYTCSESTIKRDIKFLESEGQMIP